MDERTEKNRDAKKRRQKKLFYLMIYLFMAVYGGAGAYLLGDSAEQIFAGKRVLGILVSVLIIILAGLLTFILHIYIHETGHMIFGLLTGYRFCSIRFGSLMLIKTEDGLKFRKFTLAGTGGQCLMVPPETDGDDFPTGWYNMGGCLANLIAALICAAVCACAAHPLARFAWGMMALSGIFSALMNGIPVAAVGNDGYNTLYLKKNPMARRAFKHQLLINSQLAAGRSIREMPAEWFEWTYEPTEDALTASAGVMRLNYLVECRDFAGVRSLGEYLLEHAAALADVHDICVRAEMLFADMMLHADPCMIRVTFAALEQKLELLKAVPSTQRVLYAYYTLIEKDEAKAKKALDAFEKIAVKYPYPSELAGERELMALAEKEQIEM